MVSGPPDDVSVIIIRLQAVLRRLGECKWFSRNRLALNVSKSRVIVFGSKATLRRADLKTLDVLVFDAALPVKSSILSLGVIIIDSVLPGASIFVSPQVNVWEC